MRIAPLLMIGACALAGCGPKVPPLTGVPAPAHLPHTSLPPGHWQLLFRWTLTEPTAHLHGDGIARLAAPDSVRLDFFLSGGMASGHAVLIGDDLRIPGIGLLGRFLPGPALLWATMGRLDIPPAADTVVRVDGDTLRADIGRGLHWRLAFVGGDLRRLERIDGGRLREWVARGSRGDVRFERPTARRVLEITVLASTEASEFDASIWQ